MSVSAQLVGEELNRRVGGRINVAVDNSTEPNNFDEAMAGSNADEWRKAMKRLLLCRLMALGGWNVPLLAHVYCHADGSTK